ncbi:MAG TPA: ATP-binding protein [Acidimicrobiales bacterium]|nr:ATP-binding protein [Acidimicrobiales bacterium]
MSGNHQLIEVAHFGADWESAGAARRFVSATLASWGCDAFDYVAILLVSELVSNVLLHAGTDLDVVLRRPDAGIRVEVHDRNHCLPARKHYSITSTTGRGLALVDDLARDWGAEVTAEGKFVWFEFDEGGLSVDQSLTGQFELDDWEVLSDFEPGPSPAGDLSANNQDGGATPTRARAEPATVGCS